MRKAFSCNESFSDFRYFFIIHKFTVKFLFSYIANFFPNYHKSIKNLSYFIKKYKNLVLSECLLYLLISGKNMHEGLIS